jgi:hypothetical protein
VYSSLSSIAESCSTERVNIVLYVSAVFGRPQQTTFQGVAPTDDWWSISARHSVGVAVAAEAATAIT